MSTKIHPKCPREFTKKMSTKSHPKRGLLVDTFVHEMSPKVSTRSHPFCPREVTYYVHEMSATQKKYENYAREFLLLIKYLDYSWCVYIISPSITENLSSLKFLAKKYKSL